MALRRARLPIAQPHVLGAGLVVDLAALVELAPGRRQTLARGGEVGLGRRQGGGRFPIGLVECRPLRLQLALPVAQAQALALALAQRQRCGMVGGAAALDLGLGGRQPLTGDAGGGTRLATCRLGLLRAQSLRDRPVARPARKLAQLLLDAVHLVGKRRQLGGEAGIGSACLGGGIARRLERHARRPPRVVGLLQRRPRTACRLLGRGQLHLPGREHRLLLRALGLEPAQPRTLTQTGRTRPRGVRQAHETVPAPQAAVLADQPLALQEPALQRGRHRRARRRRSGRACGPVRPVR